jgi:hypothetical protein
MMIDVAIGDAPDLPAALPSDHDDDDRGAMPQLATLFITPVIYVYLENFRRMFREHAVAVPAPPLHEPNAPLVGD